MDGFSTIRFVLGIAFLGYASASDLKTRRVNDWVWIVLGGIALVVLESELLLKGASFEHQMILLPTAMIFFSVFFGEEILTEEGFRFRPLRLTLYGAAVVIFLYTTYHFWSATGSDADSYWAHVSMPALLVVAHAFYQFGVLRGGADAKAFMTIALLVPSYPTLAEGLPLFSLPSHVQSFASLAFPFALVTLLDAALILVFLPFCLLAYNIIKGEAKGVVALFGYRVDIDDIPKFAWLMDRIEGGEHVRVLLPRRRENREEQVRQLREKGFKRVWVTPQIPFLVPMTIGFVAAFLVGNFVVGLTLAFGR